MRVVVVSCLLTLTACIGEPFTIGEIAPMDGGPVLAELAPDAVVARDSGAADPLPDVSAVGISQDGAANAFPDAGAEVDARRAEPPEAGSESEASTTPEAATPEDAALEAEPLEAAAPEAAAPEAAAPEAAAPEAGCGGLLYCQAPPSSTVCSDMHPTVSFSCSSGTCQPGDLCTFPVPNYPDYPECAGTVLCAE